MKKAILTTLCILFAATTICTAQNNNDEKKSERQAKRQEMIKKTTERMKNELKLSKNINKYLDMCLKCNKCDDFCPAEIKATEILTCAKNEYMKNHLFGKFTYLLQSKILFSNLINFCKILTKMPRKPLNTAAYH